MMTYPSALSKAPEAPQSSLERWPTPPQRRTSHTTSPSSASMVRPSVET